MAVNPRLFTVVVIQNLTSIICLLLTQLPHCLTGDVMWGKKSTHSLRYFQGTIPLVRHWSTFTFETSRCFIATALQICIILNSVRQHNHFITQGNYKATCFDCRLVILRSILSIVLPDAMHTLGSHRVYIHVTHKIKSFVSKGVTCKLCLQEWDT